MARKDAGCEELPVCDLTALLIEQLLDPFVTHSCHEELSSFLLFCYADVRFRFGANIGSRIVVISASRSSSSAVALLITVY